MIVNTDHHPLSADVNPQQQQLQLQEMPDAPGGLSNSCQDSSNHYYYEDDDCLSNQGLLSQDWAGPELDKEIVVEARYLDTPRGDKLHCRYWRPEREEDIKVRKISGNGKIWWRS